MNKNYAFFVYVFKYLIIKIKWQQCYHPRSGTPSQMRETRRVRVPCVASTPRQPRRHRAGQQHEHCRGHRPGRGGRLQKSREFPWWLLPAGRFPVVAGSRGMFSRGGRFLYKKSREFPWWLVPAVRVSVEASSRPKTPLNSCDG